MGKYYRINQNIRVPELRVLGNDGKQIGILKIEEALELARTQGVDLVEIASTAKPPVAKIIDFNKFLYLEEKKERKSKKGSKGGDIKEIRFTPFIAQGDFDFRIKRTKEFLGEGNKVRVVIRFVGRQLTKKQFGYTLIKKIMETLAPYAEAENEPKWMGPNLIVAFNPKKKGDHGKNETENQKINNQEIQNNQNG